MPHFTFQQPVELFTVRHGQSLGQINQSAYKTLGDAALPLTDLGFQQAREAGSLLNTYARSSGIVPLTIYTSTCLRTRQTASEIFNQAAPGTYAAIVTDTRLDKQKFGIFDGQFSSAERHANNPEAFADYQRQRETVGDFYARPRGGESIADLVEKAGSFLRDIAAAGKPAIVVTHGLPALCLEKALLGHNAQWVLDRQDTIPNCAIRTLKSAEPVLPGTSFKPFWGPRNRPLVPEAAYV